MRRSRERREMWVSWSRNVYAREMAYFNLTFFPLLFFFFRLRWWQHKTPKNGMQHTAFVFKRLFFLFIFTLAHNHHHPLS